MQKKRRLKGCVVYRWFAADEAAPGRKRNTCWRSRSGWVTQPRRKILHSAIYWGSNHFYDSLNEITYHRFSKPLYLFFYFLPHFPLVVLLLCFVNNPIVFSFHSYFLKQSKWKWVFLSNEFREITMILVTQRILKVYSNYDDYSSCWIAGFSLSRCFKIICRATVSDWSFQALHSWGIFLRDDRQE